METLESISIMVVVMEVMMMVMMMITLMTSTMVMRVMREDYLGEGYFLKRLECCQRDYLLTPFMMMQIFSVQML